MRYISYLKYDVSIDYFPGTIFFFLMGMEAEEQNFSAAAVWIEDDFPVHVNQMPGAYNSHTIMSK